MTSFPKVILYAVIVYTVDEAIQPRRHLRLCSPGRCKPDKLQKRVNKTLIHKYHDTRKGMCNFNGMFSKG
jgi:hypothetical protein